MNIHSLNYITYYWYIKYCDYVYRVPIWITYLSLCKLNFRDFVNELYSELKRPPIQIYKQKVDYFGISKVAFS